MEVAGLALSVVGVAELCLKYGKELATMCKSFEGAEREVDERILHVRNGWYRMKKQLEFLERIWQTLTEEYQGLQIENLRVLGSKLHTAVYKLKSVLKKASSGEASGNSTAKVKRMKYPWIKVSLDESIAELSAWQNIFDPSWHLIMKVSDKIIDQQLNKENKNQSAASPLVHAQSLRDALKEHPVQEQSIFLPESGIDRTKIYSIALTSVKCVPRTNSEKWLLVDRVVYNPEVDSSLATKNIRELARKLSSVDPVTFGLLQCRGAIRVHDASSNSLKFFDILFRIPDGLDNKPETMRSSLLLPCRYSLTHKLQMARQLAKSVSSVHTLGLVHKNIRPEAVLGFPKADGSPGSFFLCGFEKIRTVDGRTQRAGDTAWERNLYRHPSRQGSHPEEIYNMQHDIYSLGICLLEIGLWNSFVTYAEDGTVLPPSPELGADLASLGYSRSDDVKEHLVRIAKERLPMSIGERYSKVVVNCLTCLDPDNADFGDQSEFEDVDGVLVGVRYIEKVCSSNFHTPGRC